MTVLELLADLAKRWKVFVMGQRPIQGGVIIFLVNTSPGLAPLSVTQGDALGRGCIFKECNEFGTRKARSGLLSGRAL